MKLLSVLLLVFGTFACGVEAPDRRTSAEVETAPPEVQSNLRSALVRWTRNASDCPQDEVRPPDIVDRGWVIIDGDQLTLGLSAMPELTGTIDGDRAEVSGVTTFMVDEEVTCTVSGVAEMRSGLVVAQVSELLSSESTLNCAQDWSLELEY